MPPTPDRPNAVDPAAQSLKIPRVTAAVLGAGIVAYITALVATLPAGVVAPRGSDATGTVWQGTVALANGATVTWAWSPSQSLETGSFAVDGTVDALDTHLTAVARLRPFGASEVARVDGRAAWSLLATAVPGLPACTIPLTVAFDSVAAHAVSGTIRSLPGTCPGAVAGTTRAVPRMLATFAGAHGRAAPWTDPATALATVDLTGGTVYLHVTAAGAAVFGRATEIEFAL